MSRRIAVDVPDKYADIFDKYMREEGRYGKDVIARALGVYDLVASHIANDGNVILEKDGKSQVIRLI